MFETIARDPEVDVAASVGSSSAPSTILICSSFCQAGIQGGQDPAKDR